MFTYCAIYILCTVFNLYPDNVNKHQTLLILKVIHLLYHTQRLAAFLCGFYILMFAYIKNDVLCALHDIFQVDLTGQIFLARRYINIQRALQSFRHNLIYDFCNLTISIPCHVKCATERH